MAKCNKKMKIEDDNESSLSSDTEDSDSSMSLNHNEENMQVDFSAYPPSMEDYDGIVRFLEKVFPSSLPIARDVADLILKHNDFGSVMKLSDEPMEDEEDFVYSIVSAIDLSDSNNIAAAIRKFLVDSCPDRKGRKAAWITALKEGRVALVISERAHNLPHQLSIPQLHSLQEELSKLPDKPFTHFVLISNLSKFVSKEGQPQNNKPLLVHTRAEEEIILENVENTYEIHHSNSEDLTAYMKKVALIPCDQWNEALKRLSKL